MYHERQHRQHCLKHALNNLLQREVFSISDLNKLADSIHAQRTLFFGNYDVNLLAVALDTLGLEMKWHDPRDTQLASLHLGQACAQQQQQVHRDAHQAHLQQQQQQHQQAQRGQARHSFEDQREFAPQQQQQREQMQDMQVKEQQKQAQEQHGQPQQHPQQFMKPDSCQASRNDAQQPCSGAADSNTCGQQQQQLVGLVLNVRADSLWARLTGGRHWLTIKCIHGIWWNLDSRLPAPCSYVRQAADVADGGAGSLRRQLQQQLKEGAHVMLVYKQQQDKAI